MNSRRVALAVCSMIMAASLGLVAFTQWVSGVASDTLPSWVDVRPGIKKVADLSDAQFQDAALDPQCKYQDVHEWGYNPGFGQKLDYTRQGCLVSMASGYYDISNKSIIAFGTDRLQRLKDPLGDDLRQIVIQPAPNTNRLAMVYDSFFPFSNGGAKLKLVDNWAEKFPASVTTDGYSNVERIRSTLYDYELKDSNGNYVEIRTQGLKFSANGEWLHVLLRDRSHAVLNVITHEIVPYSGAAESNSAVRNAVSNNGRYVAITQQQNSFKMYDLTQCEAASAEFVSRECRSIELFDRIKDFVGPNAQISIGNVEFVGVGDALDVDVRYSIDGASWQYETLRLSIPGYAPIKYLAMGDSFSSGEGAYDYRSPTDFYVDKSSYNICHQSKNSYPYILQSLNEFEWFNSVACSGALIKDVKSDLSVADYTAKDAQSLSPRSSDDSFPDNAISFFNPGYVPQVEFSKEYKPSIATISIVGNDIGFGQIVTACILNKLTIVTSGECFSDRNDREALAGLIDLKISRLSQLLANLKNGMGGSDPKLYVVGYPKVISIKGLCGLNSPLTSNEIEFANNMVEYLDTAVKVAADSVGAQYVDVSNAFIVDDADYRLCGNQQNLAMNGIVLRGSTAKNPDNIYYSETFHPDKLGQSLMANSIQAQTNGLTKSMPQPKNSIDELAERRIALVGDNDRRLASYTLLYDDSILSNSRISIQVAPKQKPLELNIDSDSTLLPPADSEATIEFHSTPIVAGTLPIAADGSIRGSVSVPDSLLSGYHQLHVKYKDISGQTIDRYTYVYVAESEQDYDGDGKANQVDACPLGKESGVDNDKDSIDDACDDEYVLSATTGSGGNENTSTPSSANQQLAGSGVMPKSRVPANIVVPSVSSADDIFGAVSRQELTFSSTAGAGEIKVQKTSSKTGAHESVDPSPWPRTFVIVGALVALLGVVIKLVWFPKS